MSKKYTYSRSIVGKVNFIDEERTTADEETFTAVEFDSFDEAIRAVDKGINDRMVELKAIADKGPKVFVTKPSQPEVSKNSTSGPGVGTTTTPVINH